MTESFALGVRAAAPCLIALLLATFVLGLIGRTMPQLNILVLGFGINAMVTFAVLSASIGASRLFVSGLFRPGVERHCLTALHPGIDAAWNLRSGERSCRAESARLGRSLACRCRESRR